MTNAADIVERYFTAFYTGDGQTARHYLRDDNFSFTGPNATFDNPDSYVKMAGHVAGPLLTRVDQHKVFVDGSDVCIFYDLVIKADPGTIPIAEWYHLEEGKIAAIRLIFDTQPFAVQTRKQPGETATDPVCHMTVDKAAAAATRSFAGNTYYFCNPGCADAFEREPEKYLVESHG